MVRPVRLKCTGCQTAETARLKQGEGWCTLPCHYWRDLPSIVTSGLSFTSVLRVGGAHWLMDERERERLCCLMSTEARRPIRDGDEWEKGDRRVKPQNRRQPGRPGLLWTAARTTGCWGSVRPALCSDHRTMQLLSQLLCRTESQCP